MELPALHFIVIDDNKLDSFITERIIQKTCINASVRSFINAKEVLELIKSEDDKGGLKIVLVVDIQMPIMNGFQFIEAFEEFTDEIKSRYFVTVLTSSTNESDLNRIRNYPSVKYLFNKPLSSAIFSEVIGNLSPEKDLSRAS